MSFTFGPDVLLDQPAYICPTARLFGRVRAGVGTSFWTYAVVRAEGPEVRLGAYCNVQDHAMLHIGGGKPTTIGDFVTIAHRAVVHGATIGDDCLIGIGATVMDGAVVGRRSVIAGHCIVTAGMEILEGSVVAGVPAKIVARRDNYTQTRRNALIYHRNALFYAQGRHDAWHGEDFAQWSAEISRRLAAGEDVRP